MAELSLTIKTPKKPMTITPEAVKRLREILEREGKPEAGLRVFISEGGCSGFSYGMALEEEPQEGDQVVETSGVKVIVDDYSWNYVAGSEIDYVNSLMGGGFTVRNPNAMASCACGHSFDTGSNAETSQGCGCGD